MVLNQPPMYQTSAIHMPVHQGMHAPRNSLTLPYRVVQVSIQVLPLAECLTKETQTEALWLITRKTMWAKCLNSMNFKNLSKLSCKEVAILWLIPVIVSCYVPLAHHIPWHEDCYNQRPSLTRMTKMSFFLIDRFYKKWKYAQNKELNHNE